MIIFLLVSMVAIFFQAVFLPVNTVILLLTVGLGYFGVEAWAGMAFALGLFYDLVSGGILGKTSLVFLGLALILWVYSRKWTISHPVVMFLFALGGDFVTRFLWGMPFSLLGGVVLGGVAGLWGWWLKSYQGGGSIIVRR